MRAIDIIREVIAVEGRYVNDPSDSGGETNKGITERVARRGGYTAAMRNLTAADAERIYRQLYWQPICGDALLDYSELIAREVYDTAVNMGVGRAAEFLQRALNVLNNGGRHYRDLTVDGDIGPATLAALRALLHKRGGEGEQLLYRMLNALQGAFYVELAERRQKDEKYIYGWYKNRVAS